MINKIIEAIAIKLHELFGYEIYKDNIEQGLNEPCFLIVLISQNKQQLLNQRSKRELPFDIHFFPSEGDSQSNEVSETLMNELDIVKAVDGTLFAGTGMSSEIIDGVLHFRVNYNYTANKYETEDVMKEIDISNGIKE